MPVASQFPHNLNMHLVHSSVFEQNRREICFKGAMTFGLAYGCMVSLCSAHMSLFGLAVHANAHKPKRFLLLSPQCVNVSLSHCTCGLGRKAHIGKVTVLSLFELCVHAGVKLV